jgi:hypothetical protein
VFGGLTIALLVSSAVSTTVGRLIDRRGCRLVMSVGSILTAVGLVALAQVTHLYALPGRVGLPRARHAHDALRRRVRRARTGDARAGAAPSPT